MSSEGLCHAWYMRHTWKGSMGTISSLEVKSLGPCLHQEYTHSSVEKGKKKEGCLQETHSLASANLVCNCSQKSGHNTKTLTLRPPLPPQLCRSPSCATPMTPQSSVSPANAKGSKQGILTRLPGGLSDSVLEPAEPCLARDKTGKAFF